MYPLSTAVDFRITGGNLAVLSGVAVKPEGDRHANLAPLYAALN